MYNSGIISVNETLKILEIIQCGVNVILENFRHTYPNTNSQLISNLLKPYENLLYYIRPKNIAHTYTDEYHETEPENAKLIYLIKMKRIWEQKLKLDGLIENLRYEHKILISGDVTDTPCEHWYIRDYDKQIEKIVNSKSSQTQTTELYNEN